MARHRLAKRRLRSEALLLRRTDYGEADRIVSLFTEQVGRIDAVARGARRSRRRFVALEPMHLLRVSIDIVASRELGTLIEAHIQRPRIHLTSKLAAMQAAGRALRWLRRVAPAQTPEPELWLHVNEMLERLDEADCRVAPEAVLAGGGLLLLAYAGWALDLRACVRCGTACPETSRVTVDVLAGGVVCRRCGGGSFDLSAAQRQHMVAAMAGRTEELAEPADAARAIELVELALETHGLGS